MGHEAGAAEAAAFLQAPGLAETEKGLLLGWGWPPTCGGSRPAGNREAILAEQLGGGAGGH